MINPYPRCYCKENTKKTPCTKSYKGKFMAAQLITGTIASLQKCEAVIATGIQTFVKVGTALSTIKEQKLYKNTHSNFNDYCKDRWNFTQQHAGRLIVATKLVEIIESEPIGLSPPQSESQTRVLAKSDMENCSRSFW